MGNNLEQMGNNLNLKQMGNNFKHTSWPGRKSTTWSKPWKTTKPVFWSRRTFQHKKVYGHPCI